MHPALKRAHMQEFAGLGVATEPDLDEFEEDECARRLTIVKHMMVDVCQSAGDKWNRLVFQLERWAARDLAFEGEPTRKRWRDVGYPPLRSTPFPHREDAKFCFACGHRLQPEAPSGTSRSSSDIPTTAAAPSVEPFATVEHHTAGDSAAEQIAKPNDQNWAVCN
jgi:hypothetical protein